MSKLPIPPRKRSIFRPLEDDPLIAVDEPIATKRPPAVASVEPRSSFVGLRLESGLLGRIDAYAEKKNVGRSEAIRRLLVAALP